jgi:iron complex outermembrane receptor protein
MRKISEAYPRLVALLTGIALLASGAPAVSDEGLEPRAGSGAATAIIQGWTGGFATQTAQAEARFSFDIAPEPLPIALRRFEEITGLRVAADSRTIADARGNAVQGEMTAREALAILLAGTGLDHRMTDDRTIAIARAADKGPVALDPIAVTAEGATETATGPVEGYVAERSATGTKTDTPIVETPQSISVVPRDQMEAQNAETLSEALRYTAGVQSEIYGADLRGDWITVRGMEESLYQDGLRAPSGLSFGRWKIENYGLERVEVLRGPASVLYGQGAPGGLVNVVSKLPSETPINEIELRSGTYWREQLAADFSGPLTEEKDVLFRVVALGRYSENQVDYVEDNRGYFAPSLTWKPNDSTRLTLLADFQEDQVGSAINFLPYEGTIFDNPHGQISTHLFTGEPDFDGHDSRRFSLGYLFETEPTDQLTLRQSFRYSNLDVAYRQVYGIGIEADLRTLDRLAFQGQQNVDNFVVDNQAEFKAALGPVENTLLAGVDFWHQSVDTKSGSELAPTLDLYDPDYGADIDDPAMNNHTDQKRRQVGLYLQDQVAVENWRLILSGRHDWAEGRTENFIDETVARQSDSAFTGRAGIAYVSEIGLVPYASYATSFEPVAGTDADGQPFKPETGDQYEVGVKFQPEGHKSFVQVSAFQLTRQNVLTADPNDPLNQIQTGEVRNRGVEVEATASLAEGLDVIGSYTFLNARVTETNDETQGSRLGDTPEHSAALWADYTIPSGGFEGLGAGAGVRYYGSTWSYTNELKTPDFVLFDAALHYEWSNLRFALNVSNLLDNVYVKACDFYCYYGERRTVTGTVKVSW